MTANLPSWRTWKWLAAAALAACLIGWLGTDVEHLLLGWIYFPLRVLPQVTVDWPSALVGLASLIGFVAGLHFTARWFLQATASPDSSPREWSWRATAVLAVTILLLFAAGTAMVGTMHQTVWLLAGRETKAHSQPEPPPVFGVTNAARDAAQRMSEGNNLKQLSLGFQNYADRFGEALPPGGTMTEDGELLHGWAGLAAPYFMLAGEFDLSVPWNKPPNDRIYKCNLSYFVNPAIPGPYFDAEGYGLSHVAGNVHVLPIRQVRIPESKADSTNWLKQLADKDEIINLNALKGGTSNTILLGTVAENFKPWGHPANVRDPARGINRWADGFGGPRSWRGAQFAMCDGSVKFYSDKTDPRVLRALATPTGSDDGSP